MKIKRIKFQNYTVFEDQQMEFSPGINVIIGENGTGKTHLMKALYSACQSADKKTSFSHKLVMTMLPDDYKISRLITRKTGNRTAVIRDRVYIVDIICHGSPSPKLWREYAESIQKKDGRITYLTFKDKRNGWKSPTAYVKVNGSERPLKDYVRVFYNQCALRPSCYECHYATTERKTDMTIGDFWHIEETIPDFYDPNGNSLFLIHTDRGEELFEKVRDNLDYRLSNTAQCWQANLEAPTQKSEQRDVFWNDYQKKGIDFVIKKYGTVPMKTKVKNKLLKILRGGVRTK